jgi:flagellin
MSEYDIKNVLDSSYGAYVVKGTYSGFNARRNLKHNETVAVIRDMLNGKTADVRQSVKEASSAISIVQKLTNATSSISNKLLKMKELATKANSPDYSQVQKEEMQKEFKNLAKEINETAKGTKIENNKIFTEAGESISIPVGDGSKADIFAKDLSFDAEGLDISTDPETVLSNIHKATKELNEYNEYLNKQRTRIEDATAAIESEIESALGIELDDFSLIMATEMSSNTGNHLIEDDEISLNTQGNLTPEETLKLLNSNE